MLESARRGDADGHLYRPAPPSLRRPARSVSGPHRPTTQHTRPRTEPPACAWRAGEALAAARSRRVVPRAQPRACCSSTIARRRSSGATSLASLSLAKEQVLVQLGRRLQHRLASARGAHRSGGTWRRCCDGGCNFAPYTASGSTWGQRAPLASCAAASASSVPLIPKGAKFEGGHQPTLQVPPAIVSAAGRPWHACVHQAWPRPAARGVASGWM